MVYEEYLLGEKANVYVKGFHEKKANVYVKWARQCWIYLHCLGRYLNWAQYRAVHWKPKTDPPTQTARADPTPVTVDNGSLPPKTDLGRLDGGFSSSKPDKPDPIDETHERRSDLPRST